MTEELKIDLTGLMENLSEYNWLSETFIGEIKKAIPKAEIKRIIYCLGEVKRELETRNDRHAEDDNYWYLQRVLIQAKSYLDEINKKAKEAEPLMQFWTAFSAWLQSEGQDPAELFREKYQNGYSDWGQWHKCSDVHLDTLYKSTYGKEYIEMTKDNISFERLKELIEAYYREVVEITKGRLKLTIKVNELFARFKVPFKLQKGKLTKEGYKSSFAIDEIVNFEQFERKIEYANEMIAHGELLDKHSALNYISDAFCYFKSIFEDEKMDDDQLIATMINPDCNTAVYSTIKAEIENITRLINDIFDIRHNEKYAKKREGKKPKREALTDPQFIEYLYNRINAILTLIRLKHNRVLKEQREAKKSKITESLPIDEDLPF